MATVKPKSRPARRLGRALKRIRAAQIAFGRALDSNEDSATVLKLSERCLTIANEALRLTRERYRR